MFLQRLKQITFYRTLRFQLASTFLLLLTAVLAIVGLADTKNLKGVLEDQSDDEVRERLGELKGGWTYFDDSGYPRWNVDHSDPEEEAEATRLQEVYAIADDEGRVALASNDPTLKPLFERKVILAELERIKHARGPVIKKVMGTDRTPYQVISSTMMDTKHNRRWYVAEGRSLAEDNRTLKRFRTNFLILFPIALFVCALVSWYSAGAALRALQSVRNAAQEITGSNLGVQIAKRGANDELDSLIESFNEMSRRLKASFDQMRQFSTDVSHELRTPLTAIQGQLEVALFTATRKEQLQEAIENALQDVERLSNLVRALLLLSQSESGQIPMHKATVDLSELVTDLVEQFQIPAEVHRVKLTHPGSKRVWCEVDRMQMERVITNLLSNAIKYTAPDGWVKTRVESLESHARLVVEDSGVGIPPDHLPHIFDRFYRVPDPNPEKGLGLGLSFVAAIVKAHGGEIRVHSRIGQGSRFEVTLPVGSAQKAVEPVIA